MTRVSQTGQEILNDRVGTRKGYTGHLNDTAADLVYMKARYYDPQTGRFYSNDPVGFSVGNPMMFNRYVFANNSPYRFVDPDGQEGEFALSIGVAVAEYTDFIMPDLSDAAAPAKIAAYGAALVGTVFGGIIGVAISAYNSESTENDEKISGSAAVHKDIEGFETDNTANNNPLKDDLGACSECNNISGNKKQRRIYGEDGFPSIDIDYDHSHDGMGMPHEHEWDRPNDSAAPTHENRD